MSVLIRGMKMPESCYRCPMANDDFYLCGATEKYLENDSEERRPDWCPLVELPPHGRLVDADKLMMSLADWWYSSFGEEETDEAKAIRKVLDTVEQSIGEMTVVEAEGREE